MSSQFLLNGWHFSLAATNRFPKLSVLQADQIKALMGPASLSRSVVYTCPFFATQLPSLPGPETALPQPQGSIWKMNSKVKKVLTPYWHKVALMKLTVVHSPDHPAFALLLFLKPVSPRTPQTTLSVTISSSFSIYPLNSPKSYTQLLALLTIYCLKDMIYF